MDTILGILLGKSYSGIRALADLSMCVNLYQQGPYKVISTSSHGAATLQNDEGTLFMVNDQCLKFFHDTQLPEEELDIINFIEFK